MCGGEDTAGHRHRAEAEAPVMPFHQQAAVPGKVLKGEAGRGQEGWVVTSIQRTPSLGKTGAPGGWVSQPVPLRDTSGSFRDIYVLPGFAYLPVNKIGR